MKSRLMKEMMMSMNGWGMDAPPEPSIEPEPLYPHVTDKTKPIVTFAHYSDARFRGRDGWGHRERTVFGAPEEGLFYNYSDRLYGEKADAAWKVACETTEAKTAARYEKYLSEFHEQPVSIVHIIAGVNLSNGQPYLIYGYRMLGKADKPETEKTETDSHDIS